MSLKRIYYIYIAIYNIDSTYSYFDLCCLLFVNKLVTVELILY